MIIKYIILSIINLLCIVLIVNFLYIILSDYVMFYSYHGIAVALLCIILLKVIFRAKKYLFHQKVHPEGKAVLITGCARGIGKALAKHLDSRGYHVFASCLNPNSPGAADLRKFCSSRLEVFELDVTKDESVEKAARFVKDKLGTSVLWAIINNAGIQKGYLIELSSIQDFKDCIDANAIGQVRVTKAFLSLLRKCKGRVINIASIFGRFPFPFVGPYTMSKYASVGFSEYLRYELDLWGIKVISIEPEFFETDMTIPKLIRKRMDDAFTSVDEDVLRDYGEEFLKACKVLSVYVKPSRKIQKILDAVDCAISLKDPDAAYTVCRNIVAYGILKLWEMSPIVCRMLIFRITLFILRVPRPKASEKNARKSSRQCADF